MVDPGLNVMADVHWFRAKGWDSRRRVSGNSNTDDDI